MEGNGNRLDILIRRARNNFTNEGIMHEMYAESKLFQIGEIAENFCKKAIELEAQVKPSTPLEALEERRKEAIEYTKRIEEVKELCAKEVE